MRLVKRSPSQQQAALAGQSLAKPWTAAQIKMEFDMKLTEVSVDGYGVCNNLRLQNIDDGLNLVFGRAATGKSTLIRYIRNVLFGFAAQSELGHGALEIGFNGQNYRLLRTAGTDGRLVATDLRGTRVADTVDVVQNELTSVGGDAYDSAFVFGSDRDMRDLVRLAKTRCGVPVGRDAAFGNSTDLARNENQKLDLQHRLSSVDHRIADLENRRQELNHRIDQLEFSVRGDHVDVETELENVSQQLQCISVAGVTAQIQSLDIEITNLQNQIEAGQEAVAAPRVVEPTGLADLYRRLDEIDDQIRRWRQVHADIQQQRVELKNEMVVWNETGIESVKHPYHRAQEIVAAIESKVGLAEHSVGALQDVQIVTPENNALAAERLNELCGGIRRELYELCDELSDQFKQIRHRAAAAELKRLRRCYEEIGENIRVIVDRRDAVIAQIRSLDPDGARLIDRQDHDFCHCALHDGYLQARRRYAGPVETLTTTRHPVNDFASEIRRLTELREFRGRRVRELVESENRISELEARRSELLLQTTRTSDRRQLDELNEQFQQLLVELTELQKQREILVVELEGLHRFRTVTPNAILESAAVYVSRMTRGDIQRLWLSDVSTNHAGVVALDRDEIERNYESLNQRQQHVVGLAVCMSIADFFTQRGIHLPVLVDDAFDGLNDDQVRATLETMMQFCRDGHQLVAFTSNQSAAEMARRSQVTTLDLPETGVSPVGPGTPVWKPERSDDYPPREPEFLTPYTTRMHRHLQTDMVRYPQVKYPPTGIRLDHKPANFDGPLPVAQSLSMEAQSVVASNGNLSLASIGVFDSMDLDRLNRLGLNTVTQLLEIDPADLPVGFVDSNISTAQMDKWQALCWLITCVPSLKPADAGILYAIGITEPEQLETSNSSQLIERINRFLQSAEGQTFATLNNSYDRDVTNRWYDSLIGTRSSWRMPSGYSRRSRYSNRGTEFSKTHGRDRNYDRAPGQSQGNRSTIRIERDRDGSSNKRISTLR